MLSFFTLLAILFLTAISVAEAVLVSGILVLVLGYLTFVWRNSCVFEHARLRESHSPAWIDAHAGIDAYARIDAHSRIDAHAGIDAHAVDGLSKL